MTKRPKSVARPKTQVKPVKPVMPVKKIVTNMMAHRTPVADYYGTPRKR